MYSEVEWGATGGEGSSMLSVHKDNGLCYVQKACSNLHEQLIDKAAEKSKG